MAPRIVVLGATGYTGRLTAERLIAHGARPVLAGRSAERLDALAGALGGGLETAVADIGRPETLQGLVARGDVLVTTVGPFARWGRPAVRAAIDAGARYLDSTGEPPFIRSIFTEWDAPARTAGATLLTAMGYDFVPGALAAALALREAGEEEAVRVDVGYYALGGGPSSMSRGTRASIAGIALAPSFAFRSGAIRTVRSAERMRAFDVKGKARPAVSVGGAEHFTLPAAFGHLREVNAYLGWFGPLTKAVALSTLATSAVQRVPGARAVMQGAGERLMALTPSRSEASTGSSTSFIAAEAYAADGTRLESVRLTGADGYAFTAGFLAWAARHSVTGAGALSPVTAFGLDALTAGVAEAGIAEAS